MAHTVRDSVLGLEYSAFGGINAETNDPVLVSGVNAGNDRVDEPFKHRRVDGGLVQDDARYIGAFGLALVLSRRSKQQSPLLVFACARPADPFPDEWHIARFAG